ncbi:hypothetical protein HDA41_001769 [Streptomyces caelestis]|uniref:Uncharacterized protein n=1 Tax=Streptomyces caelestis TaxID=36816 RepID=A0A7W9H175_9ACTN|nr:hypothetical protein [Streptomyces caelestis]
MAATLRPLRRTVSALRMRTHPLREDLRRAQSPHKPGYPTVRRSAGRPGRRRRGPRPERDPGQPAALETGGVHQLAVHGAQIGVRSRTRAGSGGRRGGGRCRGPGRWPGVRRGRPAGAARWRPGRRRPSRRWGCRSRARRRPGGVRCRAGRRRAAERAMRRPGRGRWRGRRRVDRVCLMRAGVSPTASTGRMRRRWDNPPPPNRGELPAPSSLSGVTLTESLRPGLDQCISRGRPSLLSQVQTQRRLTQRALTSR